MRRRWWFVLAFGGGCIITICLFYFEIDLDVLPVESAWAIWAMRLVLWPVGVLLWATGSGASLGGGRYEWTPVQDFALCVGIGMAWAFWVMVAWALLQTWHARSHRQTLGLRTG
jgi:hypothetical protein